MDTESRLKVSSDVMAAMPNTDPSLAQLPMTSLVTPARLDGLDCLFATIRGSGGPQRVVNQFSSESLSVRLPIRV